MKTLLGLDKYSGQAKQYPVTVLSERTGYQSKQTFSTPRQAAEYIERMNKFRDQVARLTC